jgi:hypothetical protein
VARLIQIRCSPPPLCCPSPSAASPRVARLRQVGGVHRSNPTAGTLLSHFVTMCNQPLSIADEEEGGGGVSSAESEEAAQAINDSFSYSLRGKLV